MIGFILTHATIPLQAIGLGLFVLYVLTLIFDWLFWRQIDESEEVTG